MVNKLLQKQIQDLGIDLQRGPSSTDEWLRFLDKIDRAYSNNDQYRYLLSRSLSISSREMQERWYKLKVLEEQWRSLGECSPDLIIRADIEGKIVFVNQSRNDIPKESLIGLDLWSLYSQKIKRKIRMLFETLKLDRQLKTIEVQETGDCYGRWYAIRMSPMIRSDSLLGVLVIESDITEIRTVVIDSYVEAIKSLQQLSL